MTIYRKYVVIFNEPPFYFELLTIKIKKNINILQNDDGNIFYFDSLDV